VQFASLFGLRVWTTEAFGLVLLVVDDDAPWLSPGLMNL
jgi:hypothetical protein